MQISSSSLELLLQFFSHSPASTSQSRPRTKTRTTCLNGYSISIDFFCSFRHRFNYFESEHKWMEQLNGDEAHRRRKNGKKKICLNKKCYHYSSFKESFTTLAEFSREELGSYNI